MSSAKFGMGGLFGSAPLYIYYTFLKMVYCVASSD